MKQYFSRVEVSDCFRKGYTQSGNGIFEISAKMLSHDAKGEVLTFRTRPNIDTNHCRAPYTIAYLRWHKTPGGKLIADSLLTVQEAERWLVEHIRGGEAHDDALLTAAYWGYVDVIKALIAAGTNFSIMGGNQGQNALGVAVYANHGDIVKLLIPHCDVNARSSYSGQTAIFLAHVDRSGDVARDLIAVGADLSLVDHHGYTPLMMAAMANNRPMVEMIAERVDPRRITAGGTAEGAARRSDNIALADYLKVLCENLDLRDELRAGIDENERRPAARTI
jgi:hypothetical protein